MGLSMYLTSYLYQKTYIINQKEVMVFSMWRMIHEFFGDIIVTLFMSIVAYLIFEAPFILVAKYFDSKKLAEKETLQMEELKAKSMIDWNYKN